MRRRERRERGIRWLRGCVRVAVGDVPDLLGERLGLLLDALLEFVEAVLEALLGLLALLFELVLEVLDGGLEVLDGLGRLLLEVLVGLQQRVELLVERLEELLEQLVDGVGAVLEVGLQLVEGVRLCLLEGLVLLVDGLANVRDDLLVAGDCGLDGVEVRLDARPDEVGAALGDVAGRLDGVEHPRVDVLLELDRPLDDLVGPLEGVPLHLEYRAHRGVVFARCTSM